jgi:hypothetical protein
MEKKLRIILLGVLMTMAGTSMGFGSIVNLQSGSLNFLRGETQVNVEYEYDNLLVSNQAEQQYVNRTVAALNNKEPGRGDHWHQAWLNDRTEKFQPKFEELLNKYQDDGKTSLIFSNFKNAKYTLILKTTSISLGYNVAIARYPAMLNAEVVFVETHNRSTPLATLTITKSKGLDAWGNDYASGDRLKEAYAKAGKELGILIAKKVR